jgi:hypothetical protein
MGHLTQPQLAQLKTEITTDPRGMGYAAPYAAGNDGEVARLLNLQSANTNFQVKRSDISVADLYAAVLVSDYSALAANPSQTQLSNERRYLAWFSGLVAFTRVRLLNDDGSETPATTNLRAMFPVGSGTRNRIDALAVRDGSRAEALFGAGAVVHADDVSAARHV